MKLPVELRHTLHKNGGRITRIERIEHEHAPPQYGRSRDVWQFVGDVTWDDGTTSKGLQIAPYCICYEQPELRDEVMALNELVSDYLLDNGEWCDSTTKHEGWYAKDRPQVRRRA